MRLEDTLRLTRCCDAHPSWNTLGAHLARDFAEVDAPAAAPEPTPHPSTVTLSNRSTGRLVAQPVTAATQAAARRGAEDDMHDHERTRLKEIEQRLRRDDPALVLAFERPMPGSHVAALRVALVLLAVLVILSVGTAIDVVTGHLL